MPVKNLIGQKFSHLTVLEQAESDNNGNARWLCECDCENHTQKIVLGFALRNGTVQSCGCLRKKSGNGSTQNLTDKRFGRLTALEPTKNRNGSGSIIWKCKCDCGNITYGSTADLNRGNKTSCGCLLSKGEEKIAQILSENSINFIRQYIPENCTNPKTNTRLRFDFAVLKDKQIDYLIEYDGQQHYNEWEITNESLFDRQFRDKVKDDWCSTNNIPLIRIPYWQYNDINIKLLMKVREEIRNGEGAETDSI